MKDINLGKKRGRLEIIYEILSTCKKPKSQTHIMRRCNLHHTSLLEILKLLTSNNLLSNVNGKKGKVFQTTDDGRRFIKSYGELRKLLNR